MTQTRIFLLVGIKFERESFLARLLRLVAEFFQWLVRWVKPRRE